MCNFKLGNFGDAVKGGLDPLEVAHKSEDGSVKNNLFDPLRLKDANKTKETTTTIPYIAPKSYNQPPPAYSTNNSGRISQNQFSSSTTPMGKKLELFK